MHSYQENIRVRLRFDLPPPLMKPISLKCFMYMINKKKCSKVIDVIEDICKSFGLSTPSSLTLSIDGFALIPTEDVDIIRDNDQITVIKNDSMKDLHRKHENRALNSSSNGMMIFTEMSKLKKIKTEFSDKSLSDSSCKETNKHKTKKKKHSKSKDQAKVKGHSDMVAISKKKAPTAPMKDAVVKCKKNTPVKSIQQSKHNEKAISSSKKQRKTRSASSSHDDSITFTKKQKTDLSDTTYSPASSTTKKSSSSAKTSGKKKLNTPIKTEKDLSAPLSQNFDNLKSLCWPPCVGDIIAYKLLEMAEDYTPVISDFMTANVVNVNGTDPTVASLDLEILSNEYSGKNKSRKFNLEHEDFSVGGQASIMWSRLIDPKLVE